MYYNILIAAMIGSMSRSFFRSFLTILVLFLAFLPSQAVFLATSQCDAPPMATVDLVASPAKYKGHKVAVEGEFYAFSTLPLDYKNAMRSSKDYVGIVLTRPDHPKIPLVELKLAVPIKMFKDDEILSGVEHGDMVRVEGKVFAVALGEAWVDVTELKIKQKIAKDDDDEPSEDEQE